MTINHYSKEDIRYLRKNAHRLSAVELSKKLNRKPKTIMAIAHYYGISLMKYGEHHKNAKLTDEDVEWIRQLLEAGLTCKEISEKFDVSRQHISKIGIFLTRCGGIY